MAGPRSEATLRTTVVRHLKNVHACAVENGLLSPGTPDICTTIGWIELKWARKLPLHRQSMVNVVFRPTQLSWAKAHHEAGGHVWGLLYVYDQEKWMLVRIFDLIPHYDKSHGGKFSLADWHAASLFTAVGHAKKVLTSLVEHIKNL